jgi:hypothetical protein
MFGVKNDADYLLSFFLISTLKLVFNSLFQFMKLILMLSLRPLS